MGAFAVIGIIILILIIIGLIYYWHDDSISPGSFKSLAVNTSYKIGDPYGEGIIVNIYQDEEGLVHLLVVNSNIMQNVPVIPN